MQLYTNGHLEYYGNLINPRLRLDTKKKTILAEYKSPRILEVFVFSNSSMMNNENTSSEAGDADLLSVEVLDVVGRMML